MNETLLTAFDDAVLTDEHFKEILSIHPVPAILKARNLNNILIEKFRDALSEKGPALDEKEILNLQEQILSLMDEGKNALKSREP